MLREIILLSFDAIALVISIIIIWATFKDIVTDR